MDSTHKLNDLFDQAEKLLDKLAGERGPEIQNLREKLHRSMGQTRVALKSAPAREHVKVRDVAASFNDYVQNYRAESFLTLSESIDLHAMDATQVHTPATLIAVREDQLVPFNDMQALSARLNGPRQLIEINSIYGHDAFLKEAAALTPIIKHALAEHQT